MVETKKDEIVSIPLKFFEILVNDATRYSFIRNHAAAEDLDIIFGYAGVELEVMDDYIDTRWLEEFPNMVDTRADI